ncbi:uncharacterized protein FOBCDRAFT_39660 [Fusarium oxysporum Fo47]|uniref:uncharacterized protein n=1 Tax=Fusarium oxysporum Fo47 TaxID=660027 RepID=UPI002869B53E|nr:uncharacterized protein FOBCDRAFT_39660 [Fusarium oxysporum Fo47]WJG35490.1 hypothetical protein FOBCDRAFT_39660 [Fusarium oxysporum Fo47]
MPFGRRGIVCRSLWCIRQICLCATVQDLYSGDKSRCIWRLCRQVVNDQSREIVNGCIVMSDATASGFFWASVRNDVEMKWGKRGACKCSLDGRGVIFCSFSFAEMLSQELSKSLRQLKMPDRVRRRIDRGDEHGRIIAVVGRQWRQGRSFTSRTKRCCAVIT